MRTDEMGIMRTLEEDIVEIWREHGWEVIEENVKENTWCITAKRLAIAKASEEGKK